MYRFLHSEIFMKTKVVSVLRKYKNYGKESFFSNSSMQPKIQSWSFALISMPTK